MTELRALPSIPVAIRAGALNADANYFSTPGMSTYFDERSVSQGRTQAYCLAQCRILDTSRATEVIALIQRALETETMPQGRQALNEALSEAISGEPYIDYRLADETPLLHAANALGFHGLNVWENDDVGGPTSVLLGGGAPVQLLPMIDVDRISAIGQLNHRLQQRYGAGLDAEQTTLLCGDDVEHIAGALDDWEARLGIDVDDVARFFGVRLNSPGTSG